MSGTTPRRRGAERTRELLDTALDLATEVGYGGLSIEAVARRAGVGKHTIYRRWPSIAELLLDALSVVWVGDLDYRSAGSVRADLREQFLRSSRALTTAPIGPVYRAVIAEAQSDPALRATLHERFLATVEQRTLERIRRAQSRGELVAGVDLEYAAEVLCGTLYYRWLLTPRPVGEEAVDGLLDMFMSAYGVDSSAGPETPAAVDDSVIRPTGGQRRNRSRTMADSTRSGKEPN
ncbi:TetR/AcrR family transcriptional regulator [Nocardia flavorosea]|uniref:TetR/AcrR family transcriptional regulator n=1 Tax=Nocardia flavorosea TaxID=53429 RepID=A0A846YCK1_9NOCA|nr:TetR/AcrR family transcriptional regulator [Nocardia flavorosea]NKY55531.1 TetR/AcrR family transcriptional regulator [Nocardia flavorosea]